jgi:hypothetical protein
LWNFEVSWRESTEPVSAAKLMNLLQLPTYLYGDKTYIISAEIKGCQQAAASFEIKFKVTEALDTIVWTNGAGTGEWHDRRNWMNPATGSQINEWTRLTSDLTAIIPAPTGSKYKFQDLHNDNTDLHRGLGGLKDMYVVESVYPAVENVKGAVSYNKTGKDSVMIDSIKSGASAGNYIKKLIVEYGGATYIAPFVQGNKYESADVELVIDGADRGEWVLVGPHIKPGKHDMISGDFFLDYAPQVYMHELQIKNTGNTFAASWDDSFGSLTVPVPDSTCFAIKVPDEYGPLKLTAEQYYTARRGFSADDRAKGAQPVTYTWNDTELTNTKAELNLLSTENVGFKFATNTFLSNISVKQLLAAMGGGQVAVWNFEGNKGQGFEGSPINGSFTQYPSSVNNYENVYIKPMQAFAYQTGTAKPNIKESDICVVNNVSTRYNARSVYGRKPTLKLNAYIGAYGSDSYLLYDDTAESSTYSTAKDYDKLFSGSYSNVPELYFDLDEHLLHTHTFASLYEEINLGIRYGETAGAATLKFAGVDEFDEV